MFQFTVHADSYQNSCRASMRYAGPRVWQHVLQERPNLNMRRVGL
jgi:hypothetical protein